MSEPLSTGLPDLDRHLGGGLRVGQLTVFAGISQAGMTTLLDTTVRHLAFAERVPTMLVDVEISNDAHAQRFLSALAGVDLVKIQRASLAPQEDEAVARAVAATSRAPLGLTEERRVHGVRLAALKAKPRPQVIAVDGMRYLDFREDVDYDHEANVARDLRRIATDLRCAVVVTSPFRGPDLYGRRARLADLTPGLAEAADTVVLIDRPDLLDRHHERRGEVDLTVAKARAGSVGTVTVAAQFVRARMLPLSQSLAA